MSWKLSWNLSALVWNGRELMRERLSCGEKSIGKSSETEDGCAGGEKKPARLRAGEHHRKKQVGKD